MKDSCKICYKEKPERDLGWYFHTTEGSQCPRCRRNTVELADSLRAQFNSLTKTYSGRIRHLQDKNHELRANNAELILKLEARTEAALLRDQALKHCGIGRAEQLGPSAVQRAPAVKPKLTFYGPTDY